MPAQTVSQFTCDTHRCAAYFVDLDAWAHDTLTDACTDVFCTICIARSSKTCAACVQSLLEAEGKIAPSTP